MKKRGTLQILAESLQREPSLPTPGLQTYSPWNCENTFLLFLSHWDLSQQPQNTDTDFKQNMGIRLKGVGVFHEKPRARMPGNLTKIQGPGAERLPQNVSSVTLSVPLPHGFLSVSPCTAVPCFL